VHQRQHAPGCRWITESFGTNWRLTEMQAAIGRIQLRKLPEWSVQRNRHAMILADGFANVDGIRAPLPSNDVQHAYYKFYAFVVPERLKPDWSRDRIMAAINAQGIPCTVGSCSEIYREKAFVDRGWGPAGALPIAQELGGTSLMFMVHPTLSMSTLHRTVDVVRAVMSAAAR